MPATIKDIARRLNISVSTVSYALNDGPRSVPAEVKARVLEVARELDYRPNRIARQMITRRSMTLGVVPPEMGTNIFLGPYIQLAMNGIANVSSQSGRDVLVFSRYPQTDREDMISLLLDGRVDGVLFLAPHTTHVSLERQTALHLPCVAVSANAIPGIATFSANNEAGARQAMNHLYDLGHRRIAHIAGPRNTSDAIERRRGYTDFVCEKGLPFREDWMPIGEFFIEGGRRAMKQLLAMKDRPTAVFCANDETALGALLACREAGVDIPTEISLVGFDAAPNAAYAMPGLTTIRQPVGEMAAAATEALIRLIDDGTQPQNTVFQTELVLRASTGSPKEDFIS